MALGTNTTARHGVQRAGLWLRAARLASRTRADLLLGLLDAALLAAAYTSTLLLRLEGSVEADEWDSFLTFLPVAVGIGLVSNLVWGLYGPIWRHASSHEAKRLMAAGATNVLVVLCLEVLGPRLAPLSVVVFGTGVGMFLLGLVRFQSRLFSFRRRGVDDDALGVVVIGAGDAGATLVRDMLKSPQMGLVPVAVLDDDPRRWGRSIMGLRVEGRTEDLADVAARTGARQAVLAMSSPTSEVVRRAAEAAERAEIALRIVPGFASRMAGEPSVRQIRDLQIDDLIGREAVTIDMESVARTIGGRRVLVTGAGGSIGSELVRQLARHGPAQLIALDHDESHLHDLALSTDHPVVQVLADIRDELRITQVFDAYEPEIVFHAAANKHVPLLESHPCEAVATNVFGCDNILAAAASVGVERLVFVSTDKAVRSSSVMGASKRLGERLTAARAPAGAAWCCVRFGNVLGSRGSVVPTFVHQIQAGGPVTVTDERMTRYFMSIEEAVQLVIQAAALAEGGEVFVLDMGEPVRIVELAERMIRLSGRRVGSDIQIQITGLRPGEALDELLFLPDEETRPTVHPSIVMIPSGWIDRAGLEERLVDLARELVVLDPAAVRRALFAAVHDPGPDALRRVTAS